MNNFLTKTCYGLGARDWTHIIRVTTERIWSLFVTHGEKSDEPHQRRVAIFSRRMMIIGYTSVFYRLSWLPYI